MLISHFSFLNKKFQKIPSNFSPPNKTLNFFSGQDQHFYVDYTSMSMKKYFNENLELWSRKIEFQILSIVLFWTHLSIIYNKILVLKKVPNHFNNLVMTKGIIKVCLLLHNIIPSSTENVNFIFFPPPALKFVCIKFHLKKYP